MSNSKLNVSIVISLFVIIQQTACQDAPTILNDSWLNLKTQLRHKSDVLLNLLSDTIKFDKADKNLVEMMRSTAREFSLFIDPVKNPDSLTLHAVYQKQLDLNVALGNAVLLLAENEKLKPIEKFRSLQSLLEATENRIEVARRNYNEICVEYKRRDLIFGKLKRQP